MTVLVDLQKVTVRRSDRALFESLSLTISSGERVGIVGINGTGKSTLLKVIAGVEPPDEGKVLRARGAEVAYLAQEPVLSSGRVRDATGEGWEADAILDHLGMTPLRDADVTRLSGGEAKRVALARVLLAPGDLLILDEPTNHIDLPTVRWLERRLLEYRAGLVLVSHDRRLLDRVTTRMVELDRAAAYVHEGGYSAYLDARAAREEQAAEAESTRRNLARRELAWLRRGAPARTRKPQARIDAAMELISQRQAAPARAGDLDPAFLTPRLGDLVIETHGLGLSRPGSSEPVLTGVDLALDPRERLGIVGANGSGKTTLLEMIAGRLAPSAGEVVVGRTVRIGYYDQKGATLDPQARVRDLVAGSARAPGAPEDIALMERFWFTGELPFARAGTLSGGERRRLQLLLVLAERPNVLLLDEPTNDLDLDTLRSLEEFFEDWPGALVVVSHDQTFLERVTERVIAIEQGRAAEVPGGVDGWVARLDDSLAPARARVPASPAPGGPDRAPQGERTRSASTLGRLLREAERELGRLVRRRDELVGALEAASGHEELSRLGTELAIAQAEVDASEERWLALAEEDEARRSS
jgi:ABC transport system ATP-binding/permease protein